MENKILKAFKELSTQLNERFDLLSKEMHNRFEAMDNRFEAIDGRFDSMDNRLDAMDDRFDAMDSRFNGIDNRFDATDDRFGTLEAIMKIGFNDVYVRLDKHEGSINELKHEVAMVGDSTARIENKLDMELTAVFSRFKRLEQPSGV